MYLWATNLALFLIMLPNSSDLFLKIHLAPITLVFSGLGTRFQTLFREDYSSSSCISFTQNSSISASFTFLGSHMETKQTYLTWFTNRFLVTMPLLGSPIFRSEGWPIIWSEGWFFLILNDGSFLIGSVKTSVETPLDFLESTSYCSRFHSTYLWLIGYCNKFAGTISYFAWCTTGWFVAVSSHVSSIRLEIKFPLKT